jgi:hypothetical protein
MPGESEVWQKKFDQPRSRTRGSSVHHLPRNPICQLGKEATQGKEVSSLPIGRMVELAHNRPNMSAVFATYGDNLELIEFGKGPM